MASSALPVAARNQLLAALPSEVLSRLLPRMRPFALNIRDSFIRPDGRWCTRQTKGEMVLKPNLLCDDRLATDRIGASGLQHPVQCSHADDSLGLLGGKAAGSQPRSDQRLVTAHCRFY